MFLTKKSFRLNELVETVNKEYGTQLISEDMLRMRKSREKETFPKDIDGFYKTVDMVKYLNEYFKLKGIDLVLEVASKTVGIYLEISIVGRARTGKDWLAALFVKNKVMYRQLFSKLGKDCTQCRERIYISDESENKVKLHCDFAEQIKKSNDANFIDDNGIYESALKLNGREYNLDLEFENFQADLQSFNEMCLKVRELNVTTKKINFDNTFIEIWADSSVLTNEILDNVNRDWLILNVYPGESGNIENGKLAKSDMFIFALKNDNNDEADTITRIAKELVPQSADAKVITLYRNEQSIDDEEEWNENEREVIEAAKSYKDKFDVLTQNKTYLDVDLSIIKLDENIIMYPDIKKGKDDYGALQFSKRLVDKISYLLAPVDYISKIKEICNGVVERLNFFEKILKECPIKFVESVKNATLEGYDRCMSYNYANISNYAYAQMVKCREELYKYFTGFDVTEDWKLELLINMYKYLTSSIQYDLGLGVAWHPFESQPPVTMRVEESIAAGEILSETLNSGNMIIGYEDGLKKSGIESRTWNYVSISSKQPYSKKMIKRLELINELLGNYNGKDVRELVLNKHTQGIWILAEYELITGIFGFDDIEAKNYIRGNLLK